MHIESLAAALHTTHEDEGCAAASDRMQWLGGFNKEGHPHVGVVPDFTCDLEPQRSHSLQVCAFHEGEAANLHIASAAGSSHRSLPMLMLQAATQDAGLGLRPLQSINLFRAAAAAAAGCPTA